MATFRQRGKENTARILLNDFNLSKDHSYFLGIGNSVTSPVEPITTTPDTIQADHLIWDNLFFMNQVMRSDVSLMVKKYEWQANTIYHPFNKDVNQYETGEKFYVYNSENRCVYLCMSSPANESAESTYPPVGLTSDPEVKLDGYTWKFLYQISLEDLEKFDYPGYIPVQDVGTDLYTDERIYQQNVSASAIKGSIESIDVTSQGTSYTDVVNNNFNESAYYALDGYANATPDPFTGLQTGAYVVVEATGRSQLSQINNYYGGSKYVIHFENGYTGLILSSTISNSTEDPNIKWITFSICNLMVDRLTELPPLNQIFTILPYVEIIGNGSGAVAIPTMTDDRLVSKIRMLAIGSGYSYAEAFLPFNNGTELKPLIGWNGLATDVVELLGSNHLMISKKIKPTTSLSESDPVIYSLPENTGVVYEGNEYTNVISPDTYYTQLSLIKSPKKTIQGLQEIAGTSVVEIREMVLESINPKITITIGTTTNPYTNSSSFFQVDDIIVRGPNNYPDQFRAKILEINLTGYSTQLVCSLINGAFETYAGYRIKNLKTTTDTTDDTEFIFQDCDNNCSNSIYAVYENTFNTSDFKDDDCLLGTTSFANAEIVTPTAGYGYVNPLYPNRAKIKTKNVDSGFLPSRYENGEYVAGEVVTSIKTINDITTVKQNGTLVSISEPIQVIGDETIGYAYILECLIDRSLGEYAWTGGNNTPYELVNDDGISLDTNTLIQQGYDTGNGGSVGKIIRTGIPSGTGDTNIVYLYVNNYNKPFSTSGGPLYVIDDLYNPTSRQNMKLTIQSIIYQPSLVKYSGKILYINDAGPVQRRIENTENLKLLIEF